MHITTSLKIGGAEKLLIDLITHMDPIFDHEVIYFHPGPHIETLKNMSIQTYHVKGLVSLYDPFFFARLYSTVKIINPDILHTQLWAANNAGRIIGAMLKKPIVSVLHNYLDQDGRVRNTIDRYTVKLSHQLIAYSDGIAQSLLQRDSWIPASKISIVDIGIDREKLITSACQAKISREQLNLNSGHFIIGSVGRFVPVRRYDLMLDAFAIVHKKYAHARLILVGVGELEQSLRQKVLQLNLSDAVIFIVNEPGYKYYQLFDCFSLTTDKEGPSLALLEAMSFGIPCTRTNIDLTHPVIEHEINGILSPAGNVQALSNEYMRLIENPDFAKKLGEHAIKTVEQRFDITTLAQKYDAMIKNTLNERHQCLNNLR